MSLSASAAVTPSKIVSFDHRRRRVASAQTRDVSNVDDFFTGVAGDAGEARLQALQQSRAAVQMAAHVAAHAHFGARGGCK